mgnify:CR=1 FL=1
MDAKIENFRNKIKKSDDLNEDIQALTNHLNEFTGASATYIGKIVKPIKTGLAEDANDQDHHLPGAKAQIEITNASAEYEFLIGKILKQEDGVTYDLFREGDQVKQKENIVEATEAGLPKHLIVPEVVRNKDMHFFKVPRLGSYLAIKMEYQTCLYEEALDSAVNNYIDVAKYMKEIEEEKLEYENEQAEAKKEALDNGEPWTPEARDWPEPKYAAFKTAKVQFVVCLNTMGQDRQFTADEISFALKTC